MALLLPADDNIKSFAGGGEQSRDFGRIILQVGIHRDDQVARCGSHSRGQRGGLSRGAAKTNSAYVRIAAGEVKNDLSGAVSGTIVDEDDLDLRRGIRIHDAADFAVERIQALHFIEGGYDD